MVDFITTLSIHGVAVWPIVQALLTFIGAASALGIAIAPLTKTTKDDAFFAKVHDFILKLALNVNKPKTDETK